MTDKVTFMADGDFTIWRGDTGTVVKLVTPFFSHLRRYSNCGVPESHRVIRSNNGVDLSLKGAAGLLNQMASDLERLRKIERLCRVEIERCPDKPRIPDGIRELLLEESI